MSGFEETHVPFELKQAALPDKLALFGWMKGTVTIAPGVDLTEPAEADWGDLPEEDLEPSP